MLITAGSISGSFSSTPVWDVRPANAANYTVVTSGSQVTLHYSTLTPPTGIGFASPSPAVHNQNVLISVTVTNGSGMVDPNTGVVLNASTLDGSLSSVPLVLSSTISSTVHVYTNTITVPASPLLGSYILTATITDSNGQIGTANIGLRWFPPRMSGTAWRRTTIGAAISIGPTQGPESPGTMWNSPAPCD